MGRRREVGREEGEGIEGRGVEVGREWMEVRGGRRGAEEGQKSGGRKD